MTYDLAIIGGGPAGISAGVYAARKRLRTVFITGDFLSQSTVSEGIENWIGTVKIPGLEFAAALEAHLRAYASDVVDIHTGEWVKSIKKTKTGFAVETDKNKYEAKAIFVAAGSRRRKLEAPGAEKFENKGVTYCASCDGPLFAGQDVVVVGGGNAAFETAAQLLAYCPKVTLIHHGADFKKADPVTVEKVLANKKFAKVLEAEIKEFKGDKFLSSVVYETKNGEKKEIPASGVFVEIGSLPNTDFVKDLVKLDQWNRIIVDPKNQRATLDGIWAAGDCSDGLFHQNNIAAGDAVKALEDIYLHLHRA